MRERRYLSAKTSRAGFGENESGQFRNFRCFGEISEGSPSSAARVVVARSFRVHPSSHRYAPTASPPPAPPAPPAAAARSSTIPTAFSSSRQSIAPPHSQARVAERALARDLNDIRAPPSGAALLHRKQQLEKSQHPRATNKGKGSSSSHVAVSLGAGPSMGKKTRLFAPFINKTDHFT